MAHSVIKNKNTSKKCNRHLLLVVSVIFSFGTIHSQNTEKLPRLELGLSYGHSLMQHKKSETDGIMRNTAYTMEPNDFGSGELLNIVGSHVNSFGMVINYHLKGNNYIQIGYNRKIRFVNVHSGNLQLLNTSDGHLTINSIDYDSEYKPDYRRFDIAFPRSFGAFFHKSRSVPITYQKAYHVSKKRKLTLTPGLGFCYFKNDVSQAVRRGISNSGQTFVDNTHYGKLVDLRIQSSSEFINDPFYAANFDLYWYACLGIQKEFKKGNKLELVVDYMPNFRDPHYDDYIKYTVETSLYDVSDRKNPVLIETIDKGTTRFELRQGGLTFSLRYYPKAFKMNGEKSSLPTEKMLP